MKNIAKVDGVTTITEALRLEESGVDIIGVKINSNANSFIQGAVSINKMREIKNRLSIAEIAVNLTDEISSVELQSLFDIKPLYINMTSVRGFNTKQMLDSIQNNCELIYCDLHASYDDDPSWIVNRNQIKEFVPIFYQLSLLTEINGAWGFLKNECPKYTEELQIEDINKLAIRYPLLMSLDFTTKNISEINRAIPNAKGILLTLFSQKDNEYHLFDLEDAVRIVELYKSELDICHHLADG